MPSVVIGGPKKKSGGTSILNRSESLRSEFSDGSLASKKVSFNNDVRIRRIPGGIVHGQVVAVLDPSGARKGQQAVTNGGGGGCLWINSDLQPRRESGTVEQELLAEAATVLNSVDWIQCRSSPSREPSPKNSKGNLVRSKSEILPTTTTGTTTSGFRHRGVGGGGGSNINVSKFLDVDPGSNSNLSYSNNKPSRISKKPTRRRVGLNSVGESSSGSSGHESEGFHQHFSSESPLSSMSSSGEMATTHQHRYGSTPSPQVVTKSSLGSIRREHVGPPLRSSYLERTHNNNQPFSYTENHRNSPEPTPGKLNGHGGGGSGGKSTREIIYAQVVSGERKDGTPEKRTIHKKYSDLTTSTSEASPTDLPSKHIRHFVYDKENWKNLNSSHESSSGQLLSTYKGRSGYGSKNNVTTVLLNSNDEEDSLRSTTIHQNNRELFLSKNNSRSSSSPPQLSAERPFFYGDTRQGLRTNNKAFDHSSSSSPQSQFQYSSSSREQSPAGVSAAKIIRDVEFRKTTTSTGLNGAPPPPSAKTVTSYASSGAKNHTDYNYMTSKLGYLTPSEYSMDVSRLPPRRPVLASPLRPASLDRKTTTTTTRSSGQYEEVNNGWRQPGFGNQIRKSFSSNNGFSPRPVPTYATVDKNRKNSQSSNEMVGKKKEIGKTSQKGAISSNTVSNGGGGGGGGLISTLMRRKDKKVSKEKQAPGNNNGTDHPHHHDHPADGKVKPMNKFLSLFSKNGTKNGKRTHVRGSSKPQLHQPIVTDSDIDDAERKRDGEYHSWSSVDGSYRLDKPTGNQQRPKEKLIRGKSYNFGDYRQNKESPWYKERENDSAEDYRRDLARTSNNTHYKSATLGRPNILRSSDVEELRGSRTKSLDRRNLRPTPHTDRYDPPPKIIVTPNSPPVNENWEPSYPPPQPHVQAKPKLESKLSKSSIELDRYGRGGSLAHHHHHQYQNGHSPNKFRYFGDTDGESVANQRRGGAGTNSHSSRFDSPSLLGLPNGKMDQGYQAQNGNHISRRDAVGMMRKGRNDGLNSSEESESRFSKSSSRSVFLHAPTVAEIPPPTGLQRRTLSKDEISNYSGPQKQAVHLERSVSVLAPWRPRNYREKYEVRYDSEGHKDSKFRRPPKPPRSPNRKSNSPVPPNSTKRRSESTENLLLPHKTTQKQGEAPKSSTLGRFAGTLKRSKSTAAESSYGSAGGGGGWLRRKEGQRK